MEKRKVILVGTAYPFRGGIAAFNERLAWCFQKQGYEVEIWTFTVQYPNFLYGTGAPRTGHQTCL